LEALTELRAELVEHFRQEELGGYFHDVIKLAPRFKERADTLLQQHPTLQQRIDSVRLMAEQSSSSPSWWQSLDDELHKFYQVFDQHERDETALLQDAYTCDIGTDD
jgi:hypothetical protein